MSVWAIREAGDRKSDKAYTQQSESANAVIKSAIGNRRVRVTAFIAEVYRNVVEVQWTDIRRGLMDQGPLARRPEWRERTWAARAKQLVRRYCETVLGSWCCDHPKHGQRTCARQAL